MRPIYTLDLETDPFKHNRKPSVFCGGVYTGHDFYHAWHAPGGRSCIDDLFRILYELEPGVVYIHNGGRFDLYYLYHWIEKDRQIMIINNRIVKCHVQCRFGYHEFRDSYAIMPFALMQYKKDPINYAWFERKERAKHKDKILKYLKADCVYLWELCNDFVGRFGLNLTIGGTSMKELRKLHDFECLDSETDEYIRSRYYYGGRVQAFEKGILRPVSGKFHVYDINQSYPNAMKNYNHPISSPSSYGRSITSDTFFVTVRGYSKGCFPKRHRLGIDFPVGEGEYTVSIHEYEAALELNLFELEEVIETVDFSQWGCFSDFVDKFHGLRKQAQISGDDTGALFYKYVGNSAYGKFAQNPDEYYDYRLTSVHDDLESQGYEKCELIDFAEMILWRAPSLSGARYNVATGASITGAARAVLMRGLDSTSRPVYCDTDSVICESAEGLEIDDKKIGAWKHEKSGDKIAIAGKKSYALYDGKKLVKIASKGVKVSGEEMCAAAMGEEVLYKSEAPTYNMTRGSVRFMKRTLRRT